ncbi:MAG: thioredoxin-disulfide reductase [Chloroflexi bacterium]|nr:thioredoxin-disulfide reductase [Chloroflexota bacterium]MDA1239389.1 thioredoxin-disulfide reductase [Chloroflexota bacterium]
MTTAPMTPREIEIAIIGGGPAGLSAGLYAARALRSTVLFEGGVLGGQIATTDAVENYPGFPDGINGLDLALAMQRQSERFGMETVYAAVTSLQRTEDGRFAVGTEGGGDFIARSVIYTAGAEYNKLGIPGERELTGKGVSYCATCDAAFFAGQEAVVVGGGDAAVEEALFTTRYASKVTLVHRRDELRAQKVLQARAFAEPKMAFAWNTVVDEIIGTEQVAAVTLRDVHTGETRRFDTNAAFIFIGQTPNSSLLAGFNVPLDAGGHAIVNAWMETPVPGLFIAGDVRSEAARQVVSSAGDGATAAIRADQYLTHLDG